MNAISHATDLEGAVRSAWARIVFGSADAPFDAHQVWEDTGADSLQAMHLLHAIESMLGCKLSFDVIGPRTTAASLARTLEVQVLKSGDDSLPTVFLLPGLLGDEPRLAQFRRAFEGQIHFVLIDHPTLAKSAALTSLSATGKFAADAIENLVPVGDLKLAGYSFGGSVAFEAAHQLQARGRKVAMLGILDLVTHNVSAVESKYGWKHTLICRVAESDLLRQAALAVIARLWPAKLARTRQEMLAHLRAKAIRSWQPSSNAAPTLWAMSLETVASQEARLPALCSDLRALLRLPAGHLDIFNAESMEALAPAFRAAVAVASNS